MTRSRLMGDGLDVSSGTNRPAALDTKRSLGIFHSSHTESRADYSFGMINMGPRQAQGHQVKALVGVGMLERSNVGGSAASGRNAVASSGPVQIATSSRTRPPGLHGAKTLEDLTRRKREYMRRWRADPNNRAHDLLNRLKWQYQRKLKSALASMPMVNATAGRPPRCGFCHLLPAISAVKRLKCSDASRDGYVEELVLYCGKC